MNNGKCCIKCNAGHEPVDYEELHCDNDTACITEFEGGNLLGTCDRGSLWGFPTRELVDDFVATGKKYMAMTTRLEEGALLSLSLSLSSCLCNALFSCLLPYPLSVRVSYSTLWN